MTITGLVQPTTFLTCYCFIKNLGNFLQRTGREPENNTPHVSNAFLYNRNNTSRVLLSGIIKYLLTLFTNACYYFNCTFRNLILLVQSLGTASYAVLLVHTFDQRVRSHHSF